MKTCVTGSSHRTHDCILMVMYFRAVYAHRIGCWGVESHAQSLCPSSGGTASHSLGDRMRGYCGRVRGKNAETIV